IFALSPDAITTILTVAPSFRFKLRDGVRYLINPGSVGQPRDGNPLASFALFDSDSRVVTIHRIPYQIEATQQRILKAGLPPPPPHALAAGCSPPRPPPPPAPPGAPRSLSRRPPGGPGPPPSGGGVGGGGAPRRRPPRRLPPRRPPPPIPFPPGRCCSSSP